MKKSSAISLTVILFFAVLLSGCSPFIGKASFHQYENSPIHIDPKKKELDLIASDVFRIQTSVKFQLGELTPTVSAIGLATSLDQYHLLTTRHVVKIKSFQMITPLGPIEFQIPDDQKLEEETFIILDDGSRIKLEVVYSDEEKDFALLRAERKIHHFPIAIGNSDDFKVGNFIFLFGNFQTGLNIRTGYLTQLNFVRYGAEGEASNINETLFGISAVTVEGDSGAPVFLLRNGRFELGGIVTFLVPQARGLGFGVKINSIMAQINKYLNHDRGNVIDHRMILMHPEETSRRMRCPVLRRCVARSTATTAGIPYSRATTEPCVISPPTSIASLPAARKRGVQAGSVAGQTRISPGINWVLRGSNTTCAKPSTTPGETGSPTITSSPASASVNKLPVCHSGAGAGPARGLTPKECQDIILAQFHSCAKLFAFSV